MLLQQGNEFTLPTRFTLQYDMRFQVTLEMNDVTISEALVRKCVPVMGASRINDQDE